MFAKSQNRKDVCEPNTRLLWVFFYYDAPLILISVEQSVQLTLQEQPSILLPLPTAALLKSLSQGLSFQI